MDSITLTRDAVTGYLIPDGLTVKNYKGHAAHDGVAFAFEVRYNGTMLGMVENDGRGGETFPYLSGPEARALWNDLEVAYTEVNAAEVHDDDRVDARPFTYLASLADALADVADYQRLARRKSITTGTLDSAGRIAVGDGITGGAKMSADEKRATAARLVPEATLVLISGEWVTVADGTAPAWAAPATATVTDIEAARHRQQIAAAREEVDLARQFAANDRDGSRLARAEARLADLEGVQQRAADELADKVAALTDDQLAEQLDLSNVAEDDIDSLPAVEARYVTALLAEYHRREAAAQPAPARGGASSSTTTIAPAEVGTVTVLTLF